VNHQDNSSYIDMVERYFETISEPFYATGTHEDIKPHFHYQSGATPEGVERARNHQKLMLSLQGTDSPMSPLVPVDDAKWRFFWAIGERPKHMTEPPHTYPQTIP
jgi:hypothetical protein